jgi:protein involved in polysaccharide export with SLBB domain
MLKPIARLMAFLMLWNSVGFAQTAPAQTDEAQSTTPALPVVDQGLVDARSQRRFLHGLDAPIDPDKYIVGPTDEFVLFNRGPQDKQVTLRVLPEGTVVLPNVGAIDVAGLSITEMRALLDSELSPYYRNVEFDCQLVLPRTLIVNVLGEVGKPGAVELYAPFRLESALERAGNVSDRGSKRAVEIRDESGVILRVDFLKYLRLGDGQENPMLREGWTVFVPSRGPTCRVMGEVWRSGDYEVLPGETVADLVELAGGLTIEALTDRIVLERLDASDRLTVDEFAWNDADSVTVADRDVITIPDRRSFPGMDYVRVNGGGGRDGVIAIRDGETLESFMPRFVRLNRDFDLSRAVIERKTPSGEMKYIPVDLERVVAGEGDGSIALQSGDVISVPAYDLAVFVAGEANVPGPIPFQRGLPAERYVALAGGPTSSGSMDRLEIIAKDGSKRKAGRSSTVFRGETILVKQKKWKIFQTVFVSVTSLTSLVLSIYAVSRAN